MNNAEQRYLFEADYILLTVLSMLEQQRIVNLGLCQALIIYLQFRIIRLDRCLLPCVERILSPD